MNEDDIAKAMKKMVKGEKDRQRKMLHGTSKNHTQENNFKLLRNNGKIREEAKSGFNLSRKKYKLKAPSNF
jgi:hypothetical protein